MKYQNVHDAQKEYYAFEYLYQDGKKGLKSMISASILGNYKKKINVRQEKVRNDKDYSRNQLNIK